MEIALAKVTDGQPHQLGHLHGQGARVPVGRLGGHDHEVRVGPRDGGRQHLGRPEGVAAGQRIVTDEDGLGRAHGEPGAQAGGLPAGGHGHERDLVALARGQLEGHLDPVVVRVVHDELAGPVEGLGVRIERRRGRPDRGSA